jgi:hypothetical protein
MATGRDAAQTPHTGIADPQGRAPMKHRWSGMRIAPSACSAAISAVLMASPVFGADEPGVSPPPVAAPTVATESQREAATLLQGMAKYLAGLKAFTVNVRSGYDVVQSTGHKIEFGESRVVTMARPDRFRVEEVASDGTRDLALFDGRTLTVMNADSNVYAQAPQPGSVDDALVYFVRDLRMRMPLALLMTTRLPDELPQRVKSIDYVEGSDIDGVPVHHLAGSSESVDFQFWITQGERPLPLRVVLTYRNETGQPQYWANFAQWNTSPVFAKDVFKFARPQDSRQIPFAVQRLRPAGPAQAIGEITP